MGWSGGSRMMDDVIDLMGKHVKDKRLREKLYRGLIEIFEDNDCDTLYECVGHDKVFDEVWDDLYPPEED